MIAVSELLKAQVSIFAIPLLLFWGWTSMGNEEKKVWGNTDSHIVSVVYLVVSVGAFRGAWEEAYKLAVLWLVGLLLYLPVVAYLAWRDGFMTRWNTVFFVSDGLCLVISVLAVIRLG